MTQELTAFLKMNGNLNLINQRDFYTLFKNCPTTLKKQLLDMLDESNIDIINILEQDDTYYCLKSSENTLIVNKKDQKSNSYTYTWDRLSLNKERAIKMIIFPSFETALRNSIDFINIYANPEPLKQSFIDKYQWKEVDLYNFGGVKGLITQDCIDLFDPIKIKEKKIKDAAEEEYNRRLFSEITHKLLISKNKLKEELENVSIDSDDKVAISVYQDYIYIGIKYDPADLKEIISIIKKNLRYPADIIGVDPGEDFKIIPIGKRVDSIKHEVEEEFGVSL